MTERKEMNMDEHMEEYDEGILSLTDENGNEVLFDYLDVVEYEGSEYIALLPHEEDEHYNELLILKIVPVEGEEDLEEYVSVQDEAVLEAVYAILKERFKDVLEFED